MASLLSVLKPLFFSLLLMIFSPFRQHGSDAIDPVPATWPLQFHSTLYMETNGSRQIVELWYDWPNGRNFNIIQNQLGELLYDLEWGNGTSYFYTLDANRKCYSIKFPVGILRPNWLDGAEYLGQKTVDKFVCNVWTKVDFIWYYEDVVSKRPVAWDFFNGMRAHVMTFEVGKTLEDRYWQAPPYCFDEKEDERSPHESMAEINHLKMISMAL